jgi:hypothetical protein
MGRPPLSVGRSARRDQRWEPVPETEAPMVGRDHASHPVADRADREASPAGSASPSSPHPLPRIMLAPAAGWRAMVVPVAQPPDTPVAASSPRDQDSMAATVLRRGRWTPWAELLKRVFLVDVLVCPSARAECESLRQSWTSTQSRRSCAIADYPRDHRRLSLPLGGSHRSCPRRRPGISSRIRQPQTKASSILWPRPAGRQRARQVNLPPGPCFPRPDQLQPSGRIRPKRRQS